ASIEGQFTFFAIQRIQFTSAMDRIFGRFFCLLLITAVLGRILAALSPEEYWRSILPNTPMPNSISQLLTSSNASSQAHSTGAGLPKRGDHVQVNYFYKSQYPAEEMEELLKDPSMALFFLEKNLQHGKKITLHLKNMMAGTKFLPRDEADAIPFSSKELPKIFSRFAVRPGSDDAAEMRRTVLTCEQPANTGEKKVCTTSLESMVDFVTSSFGSINLNAASTVVVSKQMESRAQEYNVRSVRRMARSGQLIACHPESYMYAVFLCHLTEATRAYTASLVGEDGTAVEAVAVCHTDTSEWNPQHASFQLLGVKPGTVPVCHFVQPDAVVWTRTA
ncbi:hypothetical protein ABZP36_007269, partial [Zizania latifolia]